MTKLLTVDITVSKMTYEVCKYLTAKLKATIILNSSESKQSIEISI